jgi:hypothetical protein
MHKPLKLAVADANESRVLILNRAAEAIGSEAAGLTAALKCGPSKARLNGEDAREWVARILTHATDAPESELPGLTAALECLLSMDERPAHDLIGEARGGTTLTRRAARALRRPIRRSAS